MALQRSTKGQKHERKKRWKHETRIQETNEKTAGESLSGWKNKRRRANEGGNEGTFYSAPDAEADTLEPELHPEDDKTGGQRSYSLREADRGHAGAARFTGVKSKTVAEM